MDRFVCGGIGKGVEPEYARATRFTHAPSERGHSLWICREYNLELVGSSGAAGAFPLSGDTKARYLRIV